MEDSALEELWAPLEAILMVVSEPVSAVELADAIGADEETTEAALAALATH